jgi:hypothetical protein
MRHTCAPTQLILQCEPVGRFERTQPRDQGAQRLVVAPRRPCRRLPRSAGIVSDGVILTRRQARPRTPVWVAFVPAGAEGAASLPARRPGLAVAGIDLAIVLRLGTTANIVAGKRSIPFPQELFEMDASGKAEELLGRLHERISQEDAPDTGPLAFSNILGRRVRRGDWPDQAISTYDKIMKALDEGDFATATALGDFMVDEAGVVFGIYRDWIPKLIDFLASRGLADDELTELNEQVLGLCRTPDGRPFHARRLWAELKAEMSAFVLACGRCEASAARDRLEDFTRHWVTLHDHDVDHIYGLMNAVVERWGESAMADVWEAMVGGLFGMRYAKFDSRQYDWAESLNTNLYLLMEAMRGHLAGPGRKGNLEFEEDDVRYTVRFDPCGSGGHVLRGDQEVYGTPPRMEAPYNWRVLEEEHDFAWNKKGVCLYCTNCCVLVQKKPIEEFGYPVRVVEPPTYPDRKDAKCTWHIYKDPRNVPERFYTEVGATKPDQLRGPANG